MYSTVSLANKTRKRGMEFVKCGLKLRIKRKLNGKLEVSQITYWNVMFLNCHSVRSTPDDYHSFLELFRKY